MKINDLINEFKAPKSQYNNFGKYSFRSNEDIQSALKPLLKKYDLKLMSNSDLTPYGEDLAIGIHLAILDGDEVVAGGDGFAVIDLQKKGMDKGQATGAAFSYASKYAFGQMLLIDDTKDNDSQTKKFTKAEIKKKIENGELTSKQANEMFKRGEIID